MNGYIQLSKLQTADSGLAKGIVAAEGTNVKIGERVFFEKDKLISVSISGKEVCFVKEAHIIFKQGE
ncbi:MAG: hypothetical protein WC455_17435 [Dehalococcoidia bacterium]